MNLTFDAMVGAAYIELSDALVSRTVEVRSGLLVDLDELDCVIGVELLTPTALVRVEDISKDFHVREQDLAALSSGLRILQQMTFSSGSLTSRSRREIKETVSGGAMRPLESC